MNSTDNITQDTAVSKSADNQKNIEAISSGIWFAPALINQDFPYEH